MERFLELTNDRLSHHHPGRRPRPVPRICPRHLVNVGAIERASSNQDRRRRVADDGCSDKGYGGEPQAQAEEEGAMKLTNYYVNILDGGLYDSIPKAVFAAIAVSALTIGGDYLEDAKELILNEWNVLHQNGIVPQEPPKPRKKKVS